MALKNKDFIEIEFTARTQDGDIFDSNIKEDLEKSNLNIEPKPFVLALGEGMFLKGVEDFLVGKDVGKHKIELTSENAFGPRNPQMIQTIPMKVFREQNLNPVQGAMFNFDGKVAKILTFSGGRVMVDFNNPIAGKDVVYDIDVKNIVEKIEDKSKALISFLFRKDFPFEIKGKKLVLDVDAQFAQFAELFKDKFKDLLSLDLEIKSKEKKSEKKESKEEIKIPEQEIKNE